ncbi:unnamed protein product [Darwinula stevensoni]|uniref:Uncharacterized protein n=1 Tax=Darwinula stevensoni TaxID=69355 RepID=A0A7R8ZZP4_9CRUS|nr:unnamed protein product [Darwinula stevensoni]CAG0879211.1 unnamed protein product [Darwinula stevensoni]
MLLGLLASVSAFKLFGSPQDGIDLCQDNPYNCSPCPDHSLSGRDEGLVCSKRNIAELVEAMNVPPHIQRLDFSQNEIKLVQDGAFAVVGSVKVLDFSRNNLETIDPYAFAEFDELERLFLYKNQLIKLEENTFLGLDSLLELDVRSNNIRTVGENTFQGIPQLKKLDFSYNFFDDVKSLRLSPLKSLEELNLQGMGIKDFSSEDFITLEKLRVLDLSRNGFNEVPASGLESIRDSLEVLDLSGNPITRIRAGDFEHFSSLKVLRLNNMPNLKAVDGFGCKSPKNMEGRIIKELQTDDFDCPETFWQRERSLFLLSVVFLFLTFIIMLIYITLRSGITKKLSPRRQYIQNRGYSRVKGGKDSVYLEWANPDQ